MGKKRGLFGFLFGASLGGLVTMLSSKRSGSAIRKDILAQWNKGKPGLEVLGKEVKDMAFELKDAIGEFYNSEPVQGAVGDLADQAKKNLHKHYESTMKNLGDVKNLTVKKVKKAQKDFEQKLEEAFAKEDEGKKKKKK